MADRPVLLLVDDEPFNLDYLVQELEGLDLDILTAANGQDALQMLAEQVPDMIFLDIMMPGMNGFEVLQRLKSEPAWRHISVVIISAASDLPQVVKGIELGADDFLPKPFEPVLLHARLNAGLEKKRLRDLEQRYLRLLERELEIGKEIQAGFLPHDIPQPDGWQIAAFFRPAREVAGDFYDVFEIEPGKLALLLGDVTDKGVGAAMYMALFRSLLRSSVMMDQITGEQDEGQPILPEERLRRAVTLTNNYLCRVHDAGMFATLLFGVLDVENGQFCYLNAGHDYPYALRAGQIIAALKPTGPAAGVIDGVDYQIEGLELLPGDALVLYSDGIIDVTNPAGERFDQERWRALVTGSFESASQFLQAAVEALDAFAAGAEQYDDMSLLVVKRV
jgi:sigma-B regulation protein RsbU (phosphoserine phosphatase)